LVLSSPTVSGTATAKVRVYAVNYNVLRVMSGINELILGLCYYNLMCRFICAEKYYATKNQAIFVGTSF
jgi:hypothetical protein